MTMHSEFNTIILLTGPIEAAALAAMLRIRDPRIGIRHVSQLEELEAIDRAELAQSRLIGFSTGVIVPPRILDALGYGAYNFHPGPPTYPGWGPAYFATYDQAALFGVTVHAMIERVDAGPIVDVVMFAIPPGTAVSRLEQMAFVELTRIFSCLAQTLMRPEPLAAIPIGWSGRKSTRRQLRELQKAPASASKREAGRRAALFGSDFTGDNITVTPHDHPLRHVARGRAAAANRKNAPAKVMAKHA